MFERSGKKETRDPSASGDIQERYAGEYSSVIHKVRFIAEHSVDRRNHRAYKRV